MTQIPVPAMVFGAIDVISELRPHLAGEKKNSTQFCLRCQSLRLSLKVT